MWLPSDYRSLFMYMQHSLATMTDTSTQHSPSPPQTSSRAHNFFSADSSLGSLPNGLPAACFKELCVFNVSSKKGSRKEYQKFVHELVPGSDYRFLIIAEADHSCVCSEEVCVHVSVYVCMYVCMYVCIDEFMYACLYVCEFKHLRMFVCMYLCICVCMYACLHVCMFVFMNVRVHACNYACM